MINKQDSRGWAGVCRRIGCWPAVALLAATLPLAAQTTDPLRYDIGTPTVTNIWVDAIGGNDSNSGAASNQALRTLTAAWDRIPTGTTLTGTGYRILLQRGPFSEDMLPSYMERRLGTAAFPVIIQGTNSAAPVTVTAGLNIFGCQYLYLAGFVITNEGDLHFEQCDHTLVRGLGVLRTRNASGQSIKVNQCRYFYLEDCEVSGSDQAVDLVACQDGHIVGNRIHDANDWCMYLKGGSARFRIEANELYNGDTGGFSAGESTGFEFMASPWLHYEAYDLQFVNNLIRNTGTAGMSVQGGYNILLAHNTLYRVGTNDHLIGVQFGNRHCDGGTAAAQSNNLAGGWGSTSTEQRAIIPCRNVYIYNNLIYNPAPLQSQWKHFQISGAVAPPAGYNLPGSVRADTNLYIRGNLIWNGPADHSLLGDSAGAEAGNPTCNPQQLVADNSINQFTPALVNPAAGDFRPVPGGNVFSNRTYAIPAFPGGDLPGPPTPPAGNLTNAVPRDRTGASRPAAQPAGAWYVAVAVAAGGGPAWWSSQAVLQTAPGTLTNDFAAANLGQVKWLASRARAAMTTQYGNIGVVITNRLAAITESNNYQAVNLGQVKWLAQPFYDFLGRAYPWAGAAATNNDAVANVGQVKQAFSFTIP